MAIRTGACEREAVFTEIKCTIAALIVKIEHLQNNHDEIKLHIKEFTKDLDTILKNHSEDILKSNSSIEHISKLIKDLVEGIKTLSSAIDELDGDVSSANGKVKGVESDLERLTSAYNVRIAKCDKDIYDKLIARVEKVEWLEKAAIGVGTILSIITAGGIIASNVTNILNWLVRLTNNTPTP